VLARAVACRRLLPAVPAVLVWLSLASGVAHSAPASSGDSLWQRLSERCASAASVPLPRYPWPIAPFNQQHPVRGYFGDPRTVIYGTREGVFSFHNGIDIAAWPGNRVYPVVSGRVARVFGDEIIVVSSDHRRFQYVHVRPRVRVGRYVLASRTILGNVFRPWDHVHLTEIRGGCVVNPLGHLTPFADKTRPDVLSITFRNTSGGAVAPDDLSGNVSAVAQVQEHPAEAAKGEWRRMPVTPALVTWRLTTLQGRLLLKGTAADFRVTEPPPADFCTVYAPATLQNFAAENGHYRWGKPGRYLFQLHTDGLPTGSLPTGRYTLTVTAKNIVGTTGRRTVTIGLHHLDQLRHTSGTPSDWRCPRLASGTAASGGEAREASTRRSRTGP
jgi:hypothetical protein